MRAARVLVVGSANVDFTVAVSRLPQQGETVSEGTLLVNHGGKGANQAVGARRLGAEVRFIGCVGDDDAGRSVQSTLATEGIGVTGLSFTRAAATGTALIVVDADGRNQIAVAPGANRCLTVDQVRERRDDFAWADVLLCQFETPIETVGAALAEARAHGTVTILNPAPVPDRAIEFWPLVDYVTPNEGEAGRLTGQVVSDVESAERAATALRAQGAGAAIVTLGAAGALVASAAGAERIPARPIVPVDTTAAGDAFNAGLALGLAEGRALHDCLRLAAAAAALACTRRGAQDSLPARREVEALLAG
jgi:ribokinase